MMMPLTIVTQVRREVANRTPSAESSTCGGAKRHQVNEESVQAGLFGEKQMIELRLEECTPAWKDPKKVMSILQLTRTEAFSDVLMSHSSAVPGTALAEMTSLDLESKPFAVFESAGMGTIPASHWPSTTILS